MSRIEILNLKESVLKNRRSLIDVAHGGAPVYRLALPLAFALLAAISGHAAEPTKSVSPASVVDLTLPVHQRPKLHPELSDPVLGDQAQIVEWAWSPQYANLAGGNGNDIAGCNTTCRFRKTGLTELMDSTI